MKGKTTILVIDDEVPICRFLRHALEAHGFAVAEAHSGAEGLQRMVETRPDLVILDYGMPDRSGLEVLQELRQWSKTPVIFLTVRDTEMDKVAALDHGADDYMTKPFSVPELLARIRVALRHAKGEDEMPVFRSGALEIDRAAHRVCVNGKEVRLTPTEHAMLNLLAKHAGRVVPHRLILKEIWGPNAVERSHYLRVYFGQIRKKLEKISPEAADLIQNESGIGYRLTLDLTS